MQIQKYFKNHLKFFLKFYPYPKTYSQNLQCNNYSYPYHSKHLLKSKPTMTIQSQIPYYKFLIYLLFSKT